MVISDLWAAVILMAYYLVGLAVIPTMLKAWSNLPKEVIRKIQHVVYSLSIFILLRLFSAWYVAVGGQRFIGAAGLSGAVFDRTYRLL